MRLRAAVTSALLGAALLAGCGGEGEENGTAPGAEGEYQGGPVEGGGEPESDEAPPPAGGPGDYEFSYEGATGVVTVPTPADDPRLADIEEYRQVAGVEDVTYFVAEVDNTAGAADINMYQVVVVTDAGDQIEATGVDELIGEWRDTAPNDRYNDGVDLANEHRFFLRPGAKGYAVLAVPQQISGEPARVYVSPAGGMVELEATKVD